MNPFQWHIRYARMVAFLFALYFVVEGFSTFALPAIANLHLGYGIAVSIVYFGGMVCAPLVFLAAFFIGLLKPTLMNIVVVPFATLTQAALAAYLLHRERIDPLFRRYRDTFFFIGTILVTSLIVPLFEAAAHILRGDTIALMSCVHTYVATTFSMLIVAPFLLRWCTKPHFRRTAPEVLEIITVFIVLLACGIATARTQGIESPYAPLFIYLMLAPLFWIALRLRPRFVTLALVIVSIIAVIGAIVHTEPGTLQVRLFNVELFMIVLAAGFFVIVSQEEDRRVNTNLMRSHLAALENAVARITTESKAKNDFIAILGHELRNPLAPIVATIDFLRLKHVQDPEDTELLSMMANRMRTVRELLDDLLDIRRVSEGKITLKKDPIDLRVALKNAVISTEHHRDELHQSLIYKPPDEPIEITGDTVRLEQVFSNLLTNASRYSRPGKSIKMTAKTHKNYVEVNVTDQGIGLSPEDIETIFLPFRQIEHGELARKGLGIGLSLVRSIIEMHGGRAVARSEGKGKGSTFTVYLPLSSRGRPVPLDGTHRAGTPELAYKSHPSVLIIDDDDAVAGRVGQCLEIKECIVDYAYEVDQALAQAKDKPPDFILLNMDIANGHGPVLAQDLRLQGFAGRIIGLVNDARDIPESLLHGVVDDYLIKPAGLHDLQRVLPGLL